MKDVKFYSVDHILLHYRFKLEEMLARNKQCREGCFVHMPNEFNSVNEDMQHNIESLVKWQSEQESKHG